MALTRYDLMKRSETAVDQEGQPYPDPLSFPLNSFKVRKTPLKYSLTEVDISRIDILMFRAYGTVQYDDMLMWMNNIGILDDVETGQTFYLPERSDLESFVTENRL